MSIFLTIIMYSIKFLLSLHCKVPWVVEAYLYKVIVLFCCFFEVNIFNIFDRSNLFSQLRWPATVLKFFWALGLVAKILFQVSWQKWIIISFSFRWWAGHSPVCLVQVVFHRSLWICQTHTKQSLPRCKQEYSYRSCKQAAYQW